MSESNVRDLLVSCIVWVIVQLVQIQHPLNESERVCGCLGIVTGFEKSVCLVSASRVHVEQALQRSQYVKHC